jgi:hypothetical protein
MGWHYGRRQDLAVVRCCRRKSGRKRKHQPKVEQQTSRRHLRWIDFADDGCKRNTIEVAYRDYYYSPEAAGIAQNHAVFVSEIVRKTSRA